MRFHRNSMLAFPKHCDYACAIEVGPRTIWWRLARLIRVLFNHRSKAQ